MSINRNNYEEFFLLYVDNELSAAEKNAVEIFLQDNPDLQEEMLMLQQSVVKPDAVIFENKQKLLITAGITENLQEKLLLFLDGEASKKDTALVQQLIHSDDVVKKEWDILEQTKLTADAAVIFKDKHLLYKKETGRVVAFRWWRVAVAAIFIGFGIWGAITYSTKKGGEPGLVKNEPVKENNKPAEAITPKQIEADLTVNAAPAAVNKQQQGGQLIENPTPQHLQKKVNTADQKNTAASPQKNKNTINTPGLHLEKLNNPESNNYDVVTVTPQKQDSNIPKVETSVMDNKKEMPEINDASIVKNDFVIPASFTDNSDEDNTREVTEEDDNRKGRSKLGVFFKKVKRMVERKTNTKNSDNSIKIANLSFAVQ